MKVMAHQGDTIDALCYRHLGSTAGVVQTLALNPKLSGLGPILPEGTMVVLPEIANQTAPTKDVVQLWE